MIFFLFDVEILIKIETVNFLFFCFANEIRSEIVYNDWSEHTIWYLSLNRFVQFEKIGCFSYFNKKNCMTEILEMMALSEDAFYF